MLLTVDYLGVQAGIRCKCVFNKANRDSPTTDSDSLTLQTRVRYDPTRSELSEFELKRIVTYSGFYRVISRHAGYSGWTIYVFLLAPGATGAGKSGLGQTSADHE
jgi:hypothetical protein